MTPGATFVWLGLLSAGFGLAYYPVFNKLARGLVSPYAKAEMGKRIGAAVVDGGLVVICVVAFRTQGSPLFLLVAALYVLLRDALFVPGQSIGKFLFGLVVISLETGRPCSRVMSAQRNAMFAVPGMNLVAVCLEAATTLTDPQGQRLGDRIANTQVVDGLSAKEFVKAVQRALAELDFERRGVKHPVKVPRPAGGVGG